MWWGSSSSQGGIPFSPTHHHRHPQSLWPGAPHGNSDSGSSGVCENGMPPATPSYPPTAAVPDLFSPEFSTAAALGYVKMGRTWPLLPPLPAHCHYYPRPLWPGAQWWQQPGLCVKMGSLWCHCCSILCTPAHLPACSALPLAGRGELSLCSCPEATSRQ